ncbi:MAG: MBL fold metallo-hydrolase, partial [Dehalococcoidia bacterium]|nr:MBL fold metallo-hydrolase [Dehalococcoidia bacterium]
MKVKWLGHSAFIITSDEGIKIITDPFEPGTFGVNYGKIEEAADIVVVSHEHPDHNYVKGVPGNPQVIRGAGGHQVKGIEFTGIASYHDD